MVDTYATVRLVAARELKATPTSNGQEAMVGDQAREGEETSATGSTRITLPRLVPVWMKEEDDASLLQMSVMPFLVLMMPFMVPSMSCKVLMMPFRLPTMALKVLMMAIECR